jgi:hypothetical protein
VRPPPEDGETGLASSGCSSHQLTDAVEALVAMQSDYLTADRSVAALLEQVTYRYIDT